MIPEIIDRFEGRYDFLSNFYPASLTIDGYNFFNSEAAYQAFKCKNADDYDQFFELNGDEAKRLGSKIAMREDWDVVKLSIMERVVRAKFTQNPHLAKYLVETGDAELIEGNRWRDVFWGVHLPTGEGENNLGKILMKIRTELVRKGIPETEDVLSNVLSKHFEDNIHVYMTDITQIYGDCIVNSSGNNYLNEQGMDTAIIRAAGNDLLDECAKLEGCRISEAKITSGCSLPHKYVIHTVGSHYGQKNDTAILKQTYSNVLDLAMKNDIHSIVFPVISVGRFSFPKEMATAIAVESIRNWRRQNTDYDISVSFAVSDSKVYRFMCFWGEYLHDSEQMENLLVVYDKKN